jgi:hypothetical protein
MHRKKINDQREKREEKINDQREKREKREH